MTQEKKACPLCGVKGQVKLVTSPYHGKYGKVSSSKVARSYICNACGSEFYNEAEREARAKMTKPAAKSPPRAKTSSTALASYCREKA